MNETRRLEVLVGAAHQPGPDNPAGAAPHSIARIARIVADHPKLEPIAFGLLPKLGAAATARELEWLAENVR